MIDRQGRTELALALRRLASGRIITGEFDAVRLDVSEDPALVAIGDAGWGLYDDFLDYKLRGRRALNKEQLESVARCVLFLDSDLPYEWSPRRPSFTSFILSLVTLGSWSRAHWKRWQAQGPHEIWPFMRHADFERANAEPKRFAAAS